MEFIFSIVALLFWSGSDIFSKIGTKNDDKYSQWKVGAMVGGVMGIHAIYMLITGTPFAFSDIIVYLPASLLYIASMLIGYIGLRYIELSISSPICNGSGALALIMSLMIFGAKFVEDDSDAIFLNAPIIMGVILIVIGVIMLGFVEYFEDDSARMARQMNANRKYTKSFFAIALPVIYCILDAVGTLVDTLIADKYLISLAERYPDMDEGALDLLCGDILNTAYELTWLFMAIGCVIFLLIKKEKPQAKYDLPKLAGGICETAGQVFYMMVVVSEYTIGLVIISAYCALSFLWGRLFLKEKLSLKHYIAIALAFIGIVILGIFDV